MKTQLFFLAFIGYGATTNITSSHSLSQAFLNTILTPYNRIFGGHPVSIERHPYLVSIRLTSLPVPYSHHCGGAIYESNVILTAAHCIITRLPDQYMVIAGTNLRNGSNGYRASVRQIIKHKEYNPNTLENDIAILILDQPLPLNNKSIAPIKLARHIFHEGVVALIVGWGKMSETEFEASVLQEVELPLIGHNKCNELYDGKISKTSLCAGFLNKGGKDACQGDSGGPMVIDNMLVGIVSWGEGCAQPKHPGVYTRVSSFYPWIEEMIDVVRRRGRLKDNID